MFNESATHTNGQGHAPPMDHQGHVIDLLEREGGYVSLAHIQETSWLPRESLIRALRNLYLNERVEHIPGNGSANSRYRLLPTRARTLPMGNVSLNETFTEKRLEKIEIDNVSVNVDAEKTQNELSEKSIELVKSIAASVQSPPTSTNLDQMIHPKSVQNIENIQNLMGSNAPMAPMANEPTVKPVPSRVPVAKPVVSRVPVVKPLSRPPSHGVSRIERTRPSRKFEGSSKQSVISQVGASAHHDTQVLLKALGISAPAWANPLSEPLHASGVRCLKDRVFFDLSHRPGGLTLTMRFKDARALAQAVMGLEVNVKPQNKSEKKDFAEIAVLKTEKMTIVGNLFVMRLDRRPGRTTIGLSRYQAILMAQRIMEMTPSC